MHGTQQDDLAQLPPWHGINSVANIKGYAARRAEAGRKLRELIDAGLLDPSLVLAVNGAGVVPYYTDWPTVDKHGLNDRFIPHLPIGRRGIIAHEREAPAEYLAQREVIINDALNQLVFWDQDRRDRSTHPARSGGARQGCRRSRAGSWPRTWELAGLYQPEGASSLVAALSVGEEDLPPQF